MSHDVTSTRDGVKVSRCNIDSPTGFQCFLEFPEDPNSCNLPCQGIYADIDHIKGVGRITKSKVFRAMLKEYEKYKRGDEQDVQYPELISGMYGFLGHARRAVASIDTMSVSQ